MDDEVHGRDNAQIARCILAHDVDLVGTGAERPRIEQQRVAQPGHRGHLGAGRVDVQSLSQRRQIALHFQEGAGLDRGAGVGHDVPLAVDILDRQLDAGGIAGGGVPADARAAGGHFGRCQDSVRGVGVAVAPYVARTSS